MATCRDVCQAGLMDEIPDDQALRAAARATWLLAYVAGLGGVAAGTYLLSLGELLAAVIVWLVTFAAGACLMGVALVIRTLRGVLARLDRLAGHLRAASEPAGDPSALPVERDPWRHH